eukprot:356876-Chlamydomonas_euryale.AAC.2
MHRKWRRVGCAHAHGLAGALLPFSAHTKAVQQTSGAANKRCSKQAVQQKSGAAKGDAAK